MRICPAAKAGVRDAVVGFRPLGAAAPRQAGDYAHLVSLCGAYGKLTGEVMSPDEVAAEATLNGGESLLRRFVAASSRTNSAERSRTSSKGNAIETSPRQCSTRRGMPPRPRMRDRRLEEAGTRNIQRNLRGSPTLSQFLQELDLRQKTSPAGANDVSA